MQEFNYRRAWDELVKPAFESLSPELKVLWERVLELSKARALSWAPNHGVDFPEDSAGLRLCFEAIPSEELSRAACVLYYYGHWSYTVEGDSRLDGGAYWKFQKLADQVVLGRNEPGINGYRWCSGTWERLNWGNCDFGLLRSFMDHVEGTPLDMSVSKRKFYKSVVSVVVLSEDDPGADLSLPAIAYETSEGEWSGQSVVVSIVEVDGVEMANLLLQQGSDPEFFGLTADGGDIPDERQLPLFPEGENHE